MRSIIQAGDTLKFTVDLADYPASTHTLSYRLTPRTAGTAYTFTASASGDTHSVNVAAATTAAWAAGNYACTAWVTAGSERYTVHSECVDVQIKPDPSALTAGTDTRSQAQIALAAARAALAAWSPTTKSYTIAGRAMTFNTPDEIVRVVNYWAGEVKREARAADIAAGLGSSRGKVFVRLGRA